MRAKCDGVVCLVFVPWSTVILLPFSDVFQTLFEVPYVIKKYLDQGCVIEVPCDTVVRLKQGKKVEYYLLDRGGAVRLRGKKAKIVGLNVWGHHYVRDDTGERVLTVVYVNGRFRRVL